MKELRIKVRIDKPVSEVFSFTTNPQNTSKWIASIVTEETNEWPVKVGTIYRNRGEVGDWTEYKVTEFEKDKSFTFARVDGSYHVRYIFTPLNDGRATELEYHEWVDQGELEDPFTIDILQKLKDILES